MFPSKPASPTVSPVSYMVMPFYLFGLRSQSLESRLTPSFSDIPYPPHQQILFAVPSKYIQNPTTSGHLRCGFPIPRQYSLSLGSLQSFPTSFCASLLLSLLFLKMAARMILLKCKLNHVSPLLNSSSAFSSHLISSQRKRSPYGVPPTGPSMICPTVLLLFVLISYSSASCSLHTSPSPWLPWCSLCLEQSSPRCLHGSLSHLLKVMPCSPSLSLSSLLCFFYSTCHHLTNWVLFVYYLNPPIRQSPLFCSLLFPQHVRQCLVYRRCSLNVY